MRGRIWYNKTMTKFLRTNTFTKANVGLVPVPQGDDEYAYYENVIKWAGDELDFQVDREDDLYLEFMLDNPPVYFEDKPNPEIYVDFCQAWDFLCMQCSSDVSFEFVNGRLELVNKEE